MQSSPARAARHRGTRGAARSARPPRRRWFQPAPPIGQTILMLGSLWPLLTGQPACAAGVWRASIRSARSRAPTRSSRRPGASCPVSRFLAPRGTGEEPVAGLAAVSAPGAAAAAAEGDGVSRATAGLADFGAERPGSGDDAANALGRAAGGLANRLEQQPSVGGAMSHSGAVAVGQSYCRRAEASPTGHWFTLPAASFVSWSLACSSTQAALPGRSRCVPRTR